MKKILTFAAVALCAFSSFAVDYTWGFNNVESKDSGDEYMAHGTALLYLGTYENGVINGTLIASATSMNNDGSYSFGSPETKVVDSTGLVSNEKPQSYVLVLIDSDQASFYGSDNVKYYGTYTSPSSGTGQFIIKTGTSDIVTPPGAPGQVETAYATFVNADQFLSTNWSPAGNSFTAVPEPTSGLLMLLGVAALGLRRKRV